MAEGETVGEMWRAAGGANKLVARQAGTPQLAVSHDPRSHAESVTQAHNAAWWPRQRSHQTLQQRFLDVFNTLISDH